LPHRHPQKILITIGGILPPAHSSPLKPFSENLTGDLQQWSPGGPRSPLSHAYRTRAAQKLKKQGFSLILLVMPPGHQRKRQLLGPTKEKVLAKLASPRLEGALLATTQPSHLLGTEPTHSQLQFQGIRQRGHPLRVLGRVRSQPVIHMPKHQAGSQLTSYSLSQSK
jgi:hypothetical protein